MTLNAPALVSRDPEVLDVFVRGTNDRVYGIEWNGSAWSGWSELPGGMTTSRARGRHHARHLAMDVFVRTMSGGVAWISFDGARLVGLEERARRRRLRARRGRRTARTACGCSPAAAARWSRTSTTAARAPRTAGAAGGRCIRAPPPPGCDPAAGRLTGHAPPRQVRQAPGGEPAACGARTARRCRSPWSPSRRPPARGRARAWPRCRASTRSRSPPGRPARCACRRTAPGASSLACTTATLRTRAGVKLQATRRVRPGGRVRFRGRLKGRPVPRRGKLVELQAFDGGRWRDVREPRTGRKGSFKRPTSCAARSGPAPSGSAPACASENGYPYELGYSRRVKVRVR